MLHCTRDFFLATSAMGNGPLWGMVKLDAFICKANEQEAFTFIDTRTDED